MARDILFKAKRTDNGEWVEGFYFCMVHDDGRHVHHFIMPLRSNLSLGTSIEKIQVEIDINTLCQYTGLADKNGNKIWENDVVRYTDELVGMVKQDLIVWSGDCCSFARKHKSKYTAGFQYLWINERISKELEVIGNIFDNPEPLGGADNG